MRRGALLFWLRVGAVAVGVGAAAALGAGAAHADSKSSADSSRAAHSSATSASRPDNVPRAQPDRSKSVAAAAGPVLTRPAATIVSVMVKPRPTPSMTVPIPRPGGGGVVAAKPASPNVIGLVGTAVYSALSWAVSVFNPAPVVPPGVPVTIGRSTLAIPCGGCGLTVPATWYFPDESAPPVGLIYLQHGFFRTGANVSALAVQLADRTDSIVVAPTISSNPFSTNGYWINGTPMQQAVAALFVGDRSALTCSATAAAGHPVALPQDFVLAGHSAGGDLVTAAAGYLAREGAVGDLRAVILFDPVDYGTDMETALAELTGADYVPVLTVSSPPCPCNALGSGTAALTKARPGQFVGVRLAGGTHVDVEGASSSLLAELVCGFPLPPNVAAVQTLAGGWIADALTGSHTGIYGVPGQVISLDGATADVLP